MNQQQICVFDSGAGGLNVLNECARLMPNENFLYFADNQNMPYGNKPQNEIVDSTLRACETAIARGVKALVIACNTATTTSVSILRQRFALPILGIEPAIKPASLAFAHEKILLLCSQATARQQKFVELIFKYKSDATIILPQNSLALEIEKNLTNLSRVEPLVHQIIAPHLDARAIVLGCTHYDFIESQIIDFFSQNGRKISIFNGNKGVATHLYNTLAENGLLKTCQSAGIVEIIATKSSAQKKYERILKQLLRR